MPNVLVAVRLPPAVVEAARRLKEERGTPLSYQVSVAMLHWLTQQGYPPDKVKKKSPATSPSPGQRDRKGGS